MKVDESAFWGSKHTYFALSGYMQVSRRFRVLHYTIEHGEHGDGRRITVVLRDLGDS